MSLRWLDKIVNPSIHLWLDTIVPITDQLQFGETLGHGEVKIAKPTCNKAALYLDLAKTSCFSKEAINCHLESVIAFQIYGNYAFFFYMHIFALECDQLSCKYRICNYILSYKT